MDTLKMVGQVRVGVYGIMSIAKESTDRASEGLRAHTVILYSVSDKQGRLNLANAAAWVRALHCKWRVICVGILQSGLRSRDSGYRRTESISGLLDSSSSNIRTTKAFVNVPVCLHFVHSS
jgi:hypothetical protein